MKAAIVILLLLAAGLGAALLYRHNDAVKKQGEDHTHIVTLSNTVVETQSKLEDQQRIAAILETNLNLTVQERTAISNNFVKVTADLAKAQKDAQAAAEAAKAEMAKRDTRIAELASQIDDQTKKMVDLNSSIEGLNKLIVDTEKKLAASEGDRTFLLKELKRLQAEKAELERQFNDLAVLRTQVAKLKEELSISRRLEWLRMGIYGPPAKGAEKLITGLASAGTPAAPKTNFNLNVELKQDGSAAILTPATNGPAKPVPPK